MLATARLPVSVQKFPKESRRPPATGLEQGLAFSIIVWEATNIPEQLKNSGYQTRGSYPEQGLRGAEPHIGVAVES